MHPFVLCMFLSGWSHAKNHTCPVDVTRMTLSLSATLAGTALHRLLRNLRGGCGTARRSGRLLRLLLPLLLLCLGDGGLASSSTDLGLGGPLGHDGSQIGANDTTLIL